MRNVQAYFTSRDEVRRDCDSEVLVWRLEARVDELRRERTPAALPDCDVMKKFVPSSWSLEVLR